MEEWKDVIGFEGKYQISNLGSVKSIDRVITNSSGKKLFLKSKILRPTLNSAGYYSVQLGRKMGQRIHRLVALHFVEGDKSIHVNHIDSNPRNNHHENLEWVTIKGNSHHARNKGRMLQASNACRVTDDVQKLTMLTLSCIMKDVEILERFNVNEKYIRNIRSGRINLEFTELFNEHYNARQNNFVEQKKEILNDDWHALGNYINYNIEKRSSNLCIS